MSKHLRLLAVVLSLFAVMTSSGQAAKRVALVVGNDQYESLPKLQKAVSDAQSVGAALKDLGFDVIIGVNLSRRDMNLKLADLERAIAPGDQVFFFYAGHGVALGAENYLLPVDMPAPQAGEDGLVRNEGHAADAIIRAIQRRGAGVSFVVLDACRNNPFEASGTRDIGLSRGLSRLDAPSGVFVLFSAGIGQIALDRLSDDDSDPNSVFTRKLVPLLRTPGLTQVDLAKELQEKVSTLASTIKHTQEPAYYDQIIGRVVLNKSETAVADKPIASFDASELEETVEFEIDSEVPGVIVTTINTADEDKRVAVAAPTITGAPAGCDALLVKVGTVEDCLKPGDAFHDCDTCPEMVVLPPGTFTMGSPAGEEGRYVSEGPQHDVTIARPFAVGKFEVTFTEWEACAADGGCTSNKQPNDRGWGRDRRPVINVSWDDAKAYVSWLSKKSGKPYRLLSEAEWEYAARAGTTTRYSFGDEFSNAQANEDAGRTVVVGQYSANAFGLHDMHGNVWEWVEDCYHDSYSGAPDDGSTWGTACPSDIHRVLRGGSWVSSPRSLRAADRSRFSSGSRYDSFGFRLGRTLSP